MGGIRESRGRTRRPVALSHPGAGAPCGSTRTELLRQGRSLGWLHMPCIELKSRTGSRRKAEAEACAEVGWGRLKVDDSATSG